MNVSVLTTLKTMVMVFKDTGREGKRDADVLKMEISSETL